jgi:hypothetical protein
MPTSAPSKGICTPGFYSVNDVCIICPAGFSCQNSGLGTASFACAAGLYSNAGQSVCTQCPLGTYNPIAASSSLASCITCPNGLTTPIPGAFSVDYCVSLVSNYSMAGVSLFFGMVLIAYYILYAHFFTVAALRQRVKEDLINRCRRLYNKLRVTMESKGVKMHIAVERHRTATQDAVVRTLRIFALFFGSLIISFVFVIFGVIFVMLEIFYSAFIIWRSSVVSDLADLASTLFIQNLRSWIAIVSAYYRYLGLNVLVDYLAIPVIVIIDALQNIRIANLLGNLNVTCAGSQAPIQILLNTFILGLVVVIILSEFLLVGLLRVPYELTRSLKNKLARGLADQL